MNIIHKIKLKSLFVIVLLQLAWLPQVNAQQYSNDFEISKNIDIFTTLYKELNTEYVDGINPSQMVKNGIDAMLTKLDPYTVYIPEAEIEDYRFMTTGEYGGIGSLIHKRNEFVYISEPYENAPAQKAGLRAGDKIVSINGKPANGKDVEDVSAILKGQPGTTLDLVIERQGQPKPLTFKITREKISVNPVQYYGEVAPGVGYIKLVSFTQNASQDVKKAFLELKSKNNIKSLVIDLRDNGGGLLNEAVEIVNFFVPKSSLVVSTKGKQKDKNKTYKTTSDPIDTEIPLAVLVNGNTASASEIVSGALQDLDRAVIIGRRTFGKGLVQNIFPLTYNTQVKITVAKYYIPSGRCIQAIDYAHKNASGNPDYIPDSLITAFKTLHGRTVYDGKGIMPDMKTDTLKLSTISFNLITQYLLFDYATQYAATHPTIAPASDFKLSDQDFNDFVAFTDSKGFKFKTAVEQELEQLKKASEYEKNWDEIKPQYDAMEQALANFKKTEIMKQKAEISEMLKEEIVSRYYYQKGRVVASFSGDPDLNKAKDVLNNSPFYTSILDGTYSAGNLSPKTEKK